MANDLVELEVEKAPYPGIRRVIEKTLPRFAVESDDSTPEEYDGDGHDIPEPDPSESVFEDGADVQTYPYLISRRGHIGPSESVLASIYDIAGNLIERTQHEAGVLTQRNRYAYTASGKLERRVTEDLINENIELEERTYNSDGRVLRSVVTYGDQSQVITDHIWRNEGREQEEVTRSDDGIESHYLRLYNEKGNLIEETEINPETGERLTEYTVYDAKDNIVEIGHILEGERVPLLQYSYDDQGHEIEQIHYAESGQVISATASTYENADCVEERITSANAEEEIRVNTFDDQHRLLHSITTSGELESETVIAYDDAGRKSIQASRRTYNPIDSRSGQDISSSTSWFEYYTEAD